MNTNYINPLQLKDFRGQRVLECLCYVELDHKAEELMSNGHTTDKELESQNFSHGLQFLI